MRSLPLRCRSDTSPLKFGAKAKHAFLWIIAWPTRTTSTAARCARACRCPRRCGSCLSPAPRYISSMVVHPSQRGKRLGESYVTRLIQQVALLWLPLQLTHAPVAACLRLIAAAGHCQAHCRAPRAPHRQHVLGGGGGDIHAARVGQRAKRDVIRRCSCSRTLVLSPSTLEPQPTPSKSSASIQTTIIVFIKHP